VIIVMFFENNYIF